MWAEYVRCTPSTRPRTAGVYLWESACRIVRRRTWNITMTSDIDIDLSCLFLLMLREDTLVATNTGTVKHFGLSYPCFFWHAGLEVVTAMVMKNSIFWDITACSSLKVNRRFGRTCLHLQQSKTPAWSRWQSKPVWPHFYSCLLESVILTNVEAASSYLPVCHQRFIKSHIGSAISRPSLCRSTEVKVKNFINLTLHSYPIQLNLPIQSHFWHQLPRIWLWL
jgi:hypothetical protein